MPKFSIRRYYTYCDEFVVDAETVEAADALVDAALNTLGSLIGENAQGVVQAAANESVDYESTWGNEIDAEGAYLSDPVEL